MAYVLRLASLPTPTRRLEQESKRDVSLNVLQVDKLLTQLASFFPFSHLSVQRNPNLPSSGIEVLKSLYSSSSPTEGSFSTQIILKDLRPALYPAEETHYTATLKNRKINSAAYLDVINVESLGPDVRCIVEMASRVEL